MLREPYVIACSCPCHDGGMCGFVGCGCGESGRPRVTYPDRPPPVASSPFRWYWNDQGRARPYNLLGEGDDVQPAWFDTSYVVEPAAFAALIAARRQAAADEYVAAVACIATMSPDRREALRAAHRDVFDALGLD